MRLGVCPALRVRPDYKPRLRCYPSPIPCGHSVVVVPSWHGDPAVNIAIWYWQGVPKVNTWLLPSDLTIRQIKKRLRDHKACDIFILDIRKPDL